MKKETVYEIRRLRAEGVSMLKIAVMLQIEASDVWQASLEPDENTLIDGERLEDRVTRLAALLKPAHREPLDAHNARVAAYFREEELRVRD